MKRLNEFIDVISGIPLQSEDISEDDSGVPILRGINITEGFIRHNKEIDRYYSRPITSKMEKYLLKEKDLVIGMDGSKVGKNVAMISEFDAGSILIQRVARIKALANADISYIFQKIFSNRFQKYVDVVNTSSGIPHISVQQIQDFETGFPATLTEQKKIAVFLTLIGERIQTQNKIIERLGTLMRILKEKLLTQKLRFPSFDNDWKSELIGDSCEILMCKRIFADQTKELGEIPFYKIGTLGSFPDAYIDRKLFEEYKKKYKYPKKGEILITCSGTVGKCLQFDGEDAYYQDSNIVWIDNPTLKFSNQFLYYVMSNVDWGKLNSTTIIRIYGSDLRSFEINYPSNAQEQQKITDTLSLIDAKLKIERELQFRYKEQKKYLLQNLFI